MTVGVALSVSYLKFLMSTSAPRLFQVVMSQRWYKTMLLKWTETAHVSGRILEVGCGPGLLATWLQCRHNDVCAIDKSASMIARARTLACRCGSDVEFIQADVLEDSLPAGSFDCVLAASVLNVAKDRERLVRAMTRVVKPDGVVSVLAPTPLMNESSASRYASDFGFTPLETAVLLVWSRNARKMTAEETLAVMGSADLRVKTAIGHMNGMVTSVTAVRRGMS